MNAAGKRRWRKLCTKLFFGEKCSHCGVTKNLEFDHRDHDTKVFNISTMLAGRLDQLIEELKKCQLLCRKCHAEKTVREKGQRLTKGRDVHGTLASYRYCKCETCRAAKATHSREHRTGLSSGGQSVRLKTGRTRFDSVSPGGTNTSRIIAGPPGGSYDDATKTVK